ncbi:hypothetical protein SU69_06025 [Thermosipho melanesiensis]|uniref:Archease domain-containing protein n=3 Tax=Thermosipho melanesiensis TaxID=46541 RepID=A6LM88_THEM4|nr:archease [Thermosipho melanesiensis]ABR31039.1 hypothetical protein Tmel_1185 [Thermosipho melanesiensis BI429]APT74133.1 archease [Thermosipho melanesiensis]OOC36081.1 hypothetical protein SU68_06095 [Thermosipho melanesiensis]OOC36898.1 hypothetical protein SU69_06025 [Thermosipho melanesiensis]OOC37649.1 hypothetical protein SU70_06035 [Thermosipho melanesiensis]
MYREINHTADVAYEIEANSFLEILNDILNILKENYLPSINCKNPKFHKYKIRENEDAIFDTVNDWIASIELGYFPVELDKDYVVKFCSFEHLDGTGFKALTYHNLKLERDKNKLKLKVVFDI